MGTEFLKHYDFWAYEPVPLGPVRLSFGESLGYIVPV